MKTVFALAFVVPIATSALSAHHSFAAEYDANAPMTASGTVTKIDWTSGRTRATFRSGSRRTTSARKACGGG